MTQDSANSLKATIAEAGGASGEDDSDSAASEDNLRDFELY